MTLCATIPLLGVESAIRSTIFDWKAPHALSSRQWTWFLVVERIRLFLGRQRQHPRGTGDVDWEAVDNDTHDAQDEACAWLRIGFAARRPARRTYARQRRRRLQTRLVDAERLVEETLLPQGPKTTSTRTYDVMPNLPTLAGKCIACPPTATSSLDKTSTFDPNATHSRMNVCRNPCLAAPVTLVSLLPEHAQHALEVLPPPRGFPVARDQSRLVTCAALLPRLFSKHDPQRLRDASSRYSAPRYRRALTPARPERICGNKWCAVAVQHPGREDFVSRRSSILLPSRPAVTLMLCGVHAQVMSRDVEARTLTTVVGGAPGRHDIINRPEGAVATPAGSADAAPYAGALESYGQQTNGLFVCRFRRFVKDDLDRDDHSRCRRDFKLAPFGALLRDGRPRPKALRRFWCCTCARTTRPSHADPCIASTFACSTYTARNIPATSPRPTLTPIPRITDARGQRDMKAVAADVLLDMALAHAVFFALRLLGKAEVGFSEAPSSEETIAVEERKPLVVAVSCAEETFGFCNPTRASTASFPVPSLPRLGFCAVAVPTFAFLDPFTAARWGRD
uniref:Uncharacterized protein n=1 Tax=Mycena chlorophos TaxID=658473 RepID=A0ABQ0L785_MYCCL|nr:predicted protein [Mycena chlorophos]